MTSIFDEDSDESSDEQVPSFPTKKTRPPPSM